MTKLFLLNGLSSMNGRRGHFIYWYLDLGRFLEDFVRFLGILYWRFVVGLDHKFVVSEVQDLENGSKLWKSWENIDVII